MIEYEQMLSTMQSARDRCDETIRDLKAGITRSNLREDGALYAALETGQQVEPELEKRVKPYSTGARNLWEATVLAHCAGIDVRKYFKEPKLLAERINTTIKSIQLRTLHKLRTSVDEIEGMPQQPANYIKAAHDSLQEKGIELTIRADNKELIKPTPAKILLLRQDGRYISEDFYTKFLNSVDVKAYQNMLTEEVQEMLLLGLFPQFFREDLDHDQLEEMIRNPLVSQAMPKFYEMAKEISAATKDKPSIWERFKGIWR